MSKVNLLPPALSTLSRDLPPSQPDTLFVLGSNGGMSVAPDADFPLIFGRNEPDVHVCVGGDDPYVSRRHGIITRQYSRWVLNNIGKLAIRLSDSRLVLGGDKAELPGGYTPLFIVGPRNEHLLQVRVVAPALPPTPPSEDDAYEVETHNRGKWRLSDAERLVLVCLGQRYLRGEPQPQPLTWAQVADELNELQPWENWTWRKAARRVANVRERLSEEISGLREDEVQPPIGNMLNHNLIRELVIGTPTITRKDLKLLGD